MKNSDSEKNLLTRLSSLNEKFDKDGQTLDTYLQGMLHADYLKYWEYINLDTLLSLQRQETTFVDEKIFIVYHQITELFFSLILHETEQICKKNKVVSAEIFLDKINRINRYLESLVYYFEVVSKGMNPQEFQQFRFALYPASGFQSYQFRLIELFSTDLPNLLDKNMRNNVTQDISFDECFEHIYWRKGAIDASGQKSITLRHFEEKYDAKLLRKTKKLKERNLWQVFIKNYAEGNLASNIAEGLREIDINMNINWRLAHYRSAVTNLIQNDVVENSTGGTNWKKYLPPRFQKVIFYPELWSKDEVNDWGKSWVDTEKKIFYAQQEPIYNMFTNGDYY